MDDEQPAGEARPKRDRNKPFPKPRRKGKALKLLASGVVLVVAVLVGLYSWELGRPPWQWSREDAAGFLTFSRAQAEKARQNLARVDWAALGNKITEKTKQLYELLPQWESKLDEKIARMEQEQGRPPDPAAATPGPNARVEAPPASVAPSTYMQGCLAFREAIKTYKRSFPKDGDDRPDAELQAELKRAKGQFREAYGLLERAHAEAEQQGDPEQLAEVEEVLQQCNMYLEDCSKRETL